MIKIDSWKNVNRSALVQAVLSVLFCVVYTYIIMFLIGGEEFVGKQPTKETINGISHTVVLIVCTILAGIIPIIFLRYTNIKYLILYLPLSILYYLVIMFVCMCIFEDYNIFDLITNSIVPMPTGSFIGTIIAILINIIRNRNQNT